MSTIYNDIKYATRLLLKHPGFTLIVVLTLAIGIGANTSMFSVVNTVLLNPLPYPDLDRLVRVFETEPARERFRNPVSIPNFLDWQKQSQSFECLGLVNYAGYPSNVLLGEGSSRVKTLIASSTLFSALDVKPVLGRIFTAEEDKPNSDLMSLLSYDLWQSQFAADPDIIGRQVAVDGGRIQCTVVGVLPADFQSSFCEGFKGTQCWLSLSRIRNRFGQRHNHTSMVVAKLKPGVTLSQAQTEMDGIAAQMATQYGGDRGVRIVSLRDDLVKDVDTILWILFVAVGFLLMIVCVNVANLLLTKISSRDREMAVRAALGAGRWRLMQQVFIESLLLGILGGTLGILLAFGGNQLLFAWLGGRIPWMVELAMDGRVLTFTALACLLSCVLFSLAPAIRLLGCEVLPVLQNSAGRSTSSRYRVLQDALVVIQISMALVLLVGAGLLGRSFVSLMRTDLGMKPENVLTFQVDLPFGQFPENRTRSTFLDRVESELQALPGVRAVGSTSLLSFTASWNMTGFSVTEGLSTPADVERTARFRTVSPDYFKNIGTKLVKGRFFNERDIQGTAGKVIVNETMAQYFWPDQNPLGTRFEIDLGVGGNTPSSYEIVGIVADSKQQMIQGDIVPEMSVPNAQFPPFGAMFTVRTDVDPLSQVKAIRELVTNLDKTAPISDFRTLQGRINDTIWRERFSLLLYGFFSVTALLLASLGVYGVMAYAVNLRQQEIGIRIALGAQRGNVLGLILKRGCLLAGIGIAIGIFGALAVTRIIDFMLYQVKPLDPVTFAVVPLLLLAVSLLACYVPARRATKIDPMEALRYE
ncbi:MAG: ABC transporter permease [Phycisphaerales bacterium]|jgi:putative ABC transport system permease protein